MATRTTCFLLSSILLAACGSSGDEQGTHGDGGEVGHDVMVPGDGGHE